MKRVEVHHDGDQNYTDSASVASVGSSPRSIGAGKGSVTEDHLPPKWDDAAFLRVKLMCSHGGKILPRPHDNQLRYVGGETRIVVVNRNIGYGDLVLKLSRIFGASLIIKYQLPSEDLDALISVTSDEDLENMMEECDRLPACNRPTRLRLFLFPRKIESQTSFSDLLDSNVNREDWFVDALNGVPISSRARSEASSVVAEVPDYLSGLDSLEDWSPANHPLSTNSSSNSHQNSAEKSPPAVLVSLLHGSGEMPSATVFSPLIRPPIATAQIVSSAAPQLMSSLTSVVVDASLQGPNQLQLTAGQLQMEEASYDVPIQQKLRGSESQNTDDIDVQQGSGHLRQQAQQILKATITPDQKSLHDEMSTKMDKLIREQQQGVELPATSRPEIIAKPKTQSQERPTNLNAMNPDRYSKHVENAPLLDGAFQTKEESSRYQKDESPRYPITVSKPVDEVKQEAEVERAVPILQGGERTARKVGEDRPGERTVEQVRKFDDQVGSKILVVEHADGSETKVQLGRVPSFVETSESEVSTLKAMQEQEGLYAQIRDVEIETDGIPSTYATQPPTVQLQNLMIPTALSKNAAPSRISPSQAPQMHPWNVVIHHQQPNVTTNVYTDVPLLRTGANPAFPQYIQRQTADPVQQIPAAQVATPYRDHPYAQSSPSRFRGTGPPVYPNPSDLKRVLVRPTGPQATPSRPTLAPQMFYPVTTQMAFVDPNTTYGTYAQFSVPTTTDYAGLNPFVDDMKTSSDVPPPRYQEIYADAPQDSQSIIDGRQQGKQYIMRNQSS